MAAHKEKGKNVKQVKKGKKDNEAKNITKAMKFINKAMKDKQGKKGEKDKKGKDDNLLVGAILKIRLRNGGVCFQVLRCCPGQPRCLSEFGGMTACSILLQCENHPLASISNPSRTCGI